MKDIYILTTNPTKVKAANSVFSQYGIAIKSLDLDIPEIQAENSQEIAKRAAIDAFSKTGKAVIREDHSLFISELNFPGPYMAYADKVISPEQLLKIINTLESRKGYFELAATYVDDTGETYDFSYQVKIEFASEIRGDSSQRWERLIKFENDSRVFAEYSEEKRSHVWSKNYQKIAQHIAGSSN